MLSLACYVHYVLICLRVVIAFFVLYCQFYFSRFVCNSIRNNYYFSSLLPKVLGCSDYSLLNRFSFSACQLDEEVNSQRPKQSPSSQAIAFEKI